MVSWSDPLRRRWAVEPPGSDIRADRVKGLGMENPECFLPMHLGEGRFPLGVVKVITY